MERQSVLVNGKIRRTHRKFGNEYVPITIDVRVNEADFLDKKCDFFGKTRSDIIRDLIYEFNHTLGYPEENRVKDPGSLYEHRARKHIKEAVKQTMKRMFPWAMSEN